MILWIRHYPHETTPCLDRPALRDPGSARKLVLISNPIETHDAWLVVYVVAVVTLRQ